MKIYFVVKTFKKRFRWGVLKFSMPLFFSKETLFCQYHTLPQYSRLVHDNIHVIVNVIMKFSRLCSKQNDNTKNFWKFILKANILTYRFQTSLGEGRLSLFHIWNFERKSKIWELSCWFRSCQMLLAYGIYLVKVIMRNVASFRTSMSLSFSECLHSSSDFKIW